MHEEHEALHANNYIKSEIKNEVFKIASVLEYTDNKLFTLKYTNQDDDLREDLKAISKSLTTFYYNYRYQLVDAQRIIKQEEKREDQHIKKALEELEGRPAVGFFKLEQKAHSKSSIELLTACRRIAEASSRADLAAAIQAIDMSILSIEQIEQIQKAQEATSERLRKIEAAKAQVARALLMKREEEKKRLTYKLKAFLKECFDLKN